LQLQTGAGALVGLPPPAVLEWAVGWTGPGCTSGRVVGLPPVEREFGRVEAVGRK